MPLELGVWRIDGALVRVPATKLDQENRLEEFIHQDISLVRDDLWIIGRQVPTAFGHFIDLLAMNALGNLTVLELKRDRTPREVVAQALDYGLWIKDLGREDIARIFDDYLRKYRPTQKAVAFEAAFSERFGGSLPDSVNETHELLIVAAELDDATERIISYLTDYAVPVNAVFFRIFRDQDREYLTRAWLRDPSEAQAKTEEVQARKQGKEPWNGSDFYVSFGHGGHRDWDDAQKYGFVAAGGGTWFTRTLRQLQPGHRVFACVPNEGYVGVGRVVEPAKRSDLFEVKDASGKPVLLSSMPVKAKELFHDAGSDELAESLVRVEWIKTVPIKDAHWEKGLFANQNSACRLRSRFTIERLTELFDLKDLVHGAPGAAGPLGRISVRAARGSRCCRPKSATTGPLTSLPSPGERQMVQTVVVPRPVTQSIAVIAWRQLSRSCPSRCGCTARGVGLGVDPLAPSHRDSPAFRRHGRPAPLLPRRDDR
jgi:hypothetical protein